MVCFNQMCTSRASLTSHQLHDWGRCPCRVPQHQGGTGYLPESKAQFIQNNPPKALQEPPQTHSLAAATWESPTALKYLFRQGVLIYHCSVLEAQGKSPPDQGGCYYIFSQGFLTAKTSKRQTPNTCCCCCSSVRCSLN